MNGKLNIYLRKTLPYLCGAALLYSCASVGRLEGGEEDFDPPVMVESSPRLGSVNQKNTKRFTIEFDEYIKLDKPQEKIVFSPPQSKAPEIKANGKKVVVNMQDTLQPNTTYTIDFADAIQDNNEGNPLTQFTYTFSTGEQLDTLAVAGTVLNASNLEPIKGAVVGLYADLSDTASIMSSPCKTWIRTISSLSLPRSWPIATPSSFRRRSRACARIPCG